MSMRQKPFVSTGVCSPSLNNKSKEHAIFKRSPFITWKLDIYMINWKQKQSYYAIWIYSFGLWLDNEYIIYFTFDSFSASAGLSVRMRKLQTAKKYENMTI